MRQAVLALSLSSALGCAPTAGGAQPVAPTGTAGEWSLRAPLPEGPRQEVAVAALAGEVYVLGGFDNFGTVQPDVTAYDPASDSWRAVAPLPFALHHANVAAAGGKLVVAGSLTGLAFTADARVLLYEPSEDAWSEGVPLPTGTERGGAAVAVIDDQVYVIGGLRGGAVTDVSRYDVSEDSWESLPALPEPRDHLVAGAIDGRVYAAGGRERSISSHDPSVFIYDPSRDEWSEGAPMPTSRAGAAAAVLDGRLYVFGGEGDATAESGVFPQAEVYDPETDEWSLLAPMRTPRHGMGAAAVGDTLFIPGGGVRESFAATDVNEAFRPSDTF